MATENTATIKDFLKKAYDLESVIYSYERIRQHTQECRNKVYNECEDVIYKEKYEYGDILPRYIDHGGCIMGIHVPESRSLGKLNIGMGDYQKQCNGHFHSYSEYVWGYSAPNGYPGKKFFSDYKILNDTILIERTPEEKEAFEAERAQNIEKQNRENKSFSGILSNMIIGMLSGVGVGLIAGGLGALIWKLPFLKTFLFITLAFGAICVLVPILRPASAQSNKKNTSEPNSKEYLAEKRAYESMVDQRNNELAKAHNTIKYCDITDQEVSPLEARARQELKEHYAKNVVHPKYCNFVAVAQMYDYIDTGRCDKLEGADGAYNIFEFETRMNTIISDLKVIQQKLDVVIEYQRSIANALNRISSTLDEMSFQMNHIENAINMNTMAINSFNTAVCQQLSWIPR